MKKLNSNFEKNRIIDKKSTILTDEDMARRNKEKLKSTRIYEKDMKTLKLLAFYSGGRVNDVLKDLEKSYNDDLESGEYVPPIVPIRLPDVSKWKRKTLNFTPDLHRMFKEQKEKTGTPLIYLFSDYVEFYYRNSKYYPAKNNNKPRYFVEAQDRVPDIIEERKENNKR